MLPIFWLEAGANRILTLDLHAGQIQGFFDIPVDNLYAAPLFTRDIKHKHAGKSNLMVVSPDVGGVVRARQLAKDLMLIWQLLIRDVSVPVFPRL